MRFDLSAVPLITSDAAYVSLGERELALVSVCAVLRVDSYVEKRDDFSCTRLESCGFSVALRPQRPSGLLGTGGPRTATSTFTQLLSSDQFKFNVALRPQRP